MVDQVVKEPDSLRELNEALVALTTVGMRLKRAVQLLEEERQPFEVRLRLASLCAKVSAADGAAVVLIASYLKRSDEN